ncbi:MAG: hypothetical protein ACI4A5_06140 [Hominilimicola sp.]
MKIYEIQKNIFGAAVCKHAVGGNRRCAGISAAGEKQYIVLLSEPEVLSEERVSLFRADDEESKSEARDEIFANQAKIKAQIDSFSGISLFSEDDEFKSLSFTDVLNGFLLR